jgi:hypothetical protein
MQSWEPSHHPAARFLSHFVRGNSATSSATNGATMTGKLEMVRVAKGFGEHHAG